MAQMQYDVKRHRQRVSEVDLSKDIAKFAPGWKATHCARELHAGLRGKASCQCGVEHQKDEMRAGLLEKLGGRNNVLVTYPLRDFLPCVLTKKVNVPAGKTTTLKLGVGHGPRGGWTLVVKANNKMLAERKIDKNTCKDGWTAVTVDLSAYAGDSVNIELQNRADGWSCEAGYWSRIAVQSE